MLVGTLAAVGLTLVSPNLTYPKAVRAAAEKVLMAEGPKRAAAMSMQESADPGVATQGSKDLAALNKLVDKAHADLTKWNGVETSFVGLEKPLFELKNPGIVSIPLGFLGVILGSLLFRDKRALQMWNELYVRQNIGLKGLSNH
jgi:cation/acetate symporter